MKPPAFEYQRAEDLSFALSFLDQHQDDAKVLAGGQSLVPLLNLRLARPGVLLDINPLSSLATIRREGDELVLGALTRHRTLETSPEIRSTVPLLAECARFIGHVAIRTRGTVGGSLVHADPAAELGMAALALDATVVLASTAGERHLKLTDFFLGYYMTAIEPRELLTAVRIPVPPPGTGCAVEEFSLRHGDFALAAVAVQLRLDAEGHVQQAGVGLAGVGPAPVKGASVERALLGAGEGALEEAARAVLDDIAPEDDLHATAAYRRDLAVNLTTRALRRAYRAAKGG